MKKVAIDFRLMDTPSGKRGMGYYTFNQFQAVEELDPLILERIYLKVFKGQNGKKLNLGKNAKFLNVFSSYLPSRGIRRLDPLFKRFWHLALNQSQADIIHITHLFETSFVDFPPNVLSIVTFYDLTPFFDLKKYFPKPRSQKWYLTRLDQLKNATKIIAISESTKKDLVEHFQIPSDKIKVIYGGFDKRFKVLSSEKVKNFLGQKYNLTSKFIMAQPAFTTHKNAERIFLSFKKFMENNNSDLKLVVVCKLIPAEQSIWNKKLIELGIRDRVVLTGFVPNQDLPYFYNGAEILLYPSLYEGFGLPIIESMACGTPVITSNVSSMPEVGGDAAEYVNPKDVDSIVKTLEKVLSNKKLQQQMIKKGFEQIKKFSWEKCAQQTLAVYEEVLAES